jgi:hypothetical protein
LMGLIILVIATGAAGCCATAAGGCPGRAGYRFPATAFRNKPAGGHQSGHFFTFTGRAVRFFAAKYQVFKILVAVFAVVFVNRHINLPVLDKIVTGSKHYMNR